MSRPAGIPLLSGPPPPNPGPDQKACRKCGKEFNIIFHRQRKCMHCGYGYCSSCTDYQALMPRRGLARGYDLAPVCAFCIEMVSVTSLGRVQLRSLQLAKLKRYIEAYNIPAKNAIDKNDLVDAALAARTPQGCLLPIHEDYYRKHSVPSVSAPASSSSSDSRTNTGSRSNIRQFARPDLDPNRRQEVPYETYTPRSRTTSAPSTPRATRPSNGEPSISRPTSSDGRPSNPNTASAAPHSQSAPPLPPPPMSTLVTLPRSSLAALSVGTLKQILFDARVRVPPGVVEKEEIVDRVWAIVEEERRMDNEGLEDAGFEMDEGGMEGGRDGEEEIVVEMVDPTSETHMDTPHLRATPSASATGSNMPSSRSPSPQRHSRSPAHSPPKPRPRPDSLERSGLCVICQDEEANIAVVDCGHLAMCRECSDLVLASSKECPLCRTRIVTESRLLRIFKT